MLRIASYASDMRILEQIRLVCQAQCVCVMRASCIVPRRAYGNIHKTIVCAMRNRRETTARTSRMFYSSFRDFVTPRLFIRRRKELSSRSISAGQERRKNLRVYTVRYKVVYQDRMRMSRRDGPASGYFVSSLFDRVSTVEEMQ
jgi:hypothetical protein